MEGEIVGKAQEERILTGSAEIDLNQRTPRFPIYSSAEEAARSLLRGHHHSRPDPRKKHTRGKLKALSRRQTLGKRTPAEGKSMIAREEKTRDEERRKGASCVRRNEGSRRDEETKRNTRQQQLLTHTQARTQRRYWHWSSVSGKKYSHSRRPDLEQSRARQTRTEKQPRGGGEAPLPPPEVDGIVESPGSPARKGKGRGEEDGGRRQSSDRGGKGREAKATGRAGQAGRRVNQWRASASDCAWLALTLPLACGPACLGRHARPSAAQRVNKVAALSHQRITGV
ncbi:hypothetical protein Mp_8g01040 [Marchantia polymorpha subsp. ruderalis]|uniref:Uncharacterized protein n=1 Tax=Marchantia polymorpha TaxID=3197 RepID=A0A2R6WRC6_MARPO|nr:hypothetical protein MARPO_0064s0094 [Marchantia polymorpha]BBN18255.1 hypothetical protein Mp_8g01040 [Marchantia polymorpha subsp. ruderalis]|eukprot:PTQ36418.1 hypothetical protein MARPO_0064s0094 [Marchantia polymorpha]